MMQQNFSPYRYAINKQDTNGKENMQHSKTETNTAILRTSQSDKMIAPIWHCQRGVMTAPLRPNVDVKGA